jgi:chromosomal replication initiator protein
VAFIFLPLGPSVPEKESQEPNQVWEGVREELRRGMSPAMFENWLDPLRAVGTKGTRLYISGPERVRDWFERRYGAAATSVLRRHAPHLEEIVFTSGSAEAAAGEGAGAAQDSRLPAGLIGDLDFDRFVIGQGNRFAHSSALTVAESPGESYNPLFIYGAPGLGKTHLLVSIANYLRRQRPEMTVVYTTAERFTSEFIASVRAGGSGGEAFKERYRGVGALLIDDVQFLEGKLRTEDEFFHTFNELYAAGSQIVLSSDRPPEAMERLSERMRDRFAWGLTVKVEGPDLATRITLLRRLATEHSIPHPDAGVLRQIAAAAPGNLRRLEGALTRVLAFASLHAEPMTPELVRRALGVDDEQPSLDQAPADHPAPAERVEAIQHAVCDVLHISMAELRSKRRVPNIVRARQLGMYVARNNTDLTIAEIARGFDRDHSTVLHSIRTVERRLEPGGDLHKALEKVQERLHLGGVEG